MAAATQDLDTDRRSGKVVSLPLAAGVTLFTGTLAARNPTGYGVPASDTAGLHIVGIVQRGARNVAGSFGGPNVGDGVSALGTAGAVNVDVEKTVARLNNSATDPVDITKCEQLVYVEDDNTISATGGVNKVVAGRLLELDPADPTMVWVDTSRTS